LFNGSKFKCGIRAFLAVEQQTSQTKIALVRKVLFFTLPFITILSIMSIYFKGVSLYDELDELEMKSFICFHLEFEGVLLFCNIYGSSRFSNDPWLQLNRFCLM